MPEGDTIHRAASVLRRALLGRTVERFESCLPAVQAADGRAVVTGRAVEAVEARGKHLLMVFRRRDDAGDPSPGLAGLPLLRSDVVLHSHMGLRGSWHVYRPGERWQRAPAAADVVIHTDAYVTPCFAPAVLELLRPPEVTRHPALTRLGPDAIAPAFDVGEALVRLQRRAAAEIGVALLDQAAMAGLGNVYKSEVLFLRRVSPFTPVGDLPAETLVALIGESRRLLRLNAEGPHRRTMPGLDPRERLWVYGRRGEPCRVCGERIRMRRQGPHARSTYYCPRCQGEGDREGSPSSER